MPARESTGGDIAVWSDGPGCDDAVYHRRLPVAASNALTIPVMPRREQHAVGESQRRTSVPSRGALPRGLIVNAAGSTRCAKAPCPCPRRRVRRFLVASRASM